MEMFARHLMRLRGLSVERASTIVQRYPTLQALLRGFEECETEKDRELLLSHLHYGVAGKTIGPAISRAIYRLYTSKRLT
jgi:crossover junction endonuclease MUS81